MAPSDRKRFALCLLAASELYGREVSDAVSAVWWDALKSYDIGTVESAFRRHFANPDTGQFMPKPADIVRLVAGSSQDSAQVAWAKFDRAVRQVGPWQSVAFDDPLIHRVVHDMGGWTLFATKTDDEWPFVANEFRSRYVGYRSRGEMPEHPAKLIGFAEADNVRRSFHVSEPVFIGDASKARAVLEAGTSSPLIGITRDVAAVARRLTVIEGKA